MCQTQTGDSREDTVCVFHYLFVPSSIQWDNRYRLQLLSNKRTQCNDKPTNDQR